MNILATILMAQPSGAEGGNAFSSFLPLVLILAVFYFFMIRPQMKRQKEMRKFRQEMKKGDKVITSGGIHGKIKNITEGTIDIEVSEGVNITVEKSLINPIGAPQQGK